jgi:uncharacterized protein YdhG (YjbR/CyaY superfamily)
METSYTTIDDYVALFDGPMRETLDALRDTIRDVLRDAEAKTPGLGISEKISWQMPTWYSDGSNLSRGNLLHFAAGKNHVGLYPGPEAVETFVPKLEDAGLKYRKGTIQLPLKCFDNARRAEILGLAAEVAAFCFARPCA